MLERFLAHTASPALYALIISSTFVHDMRNIDITTKVMLVRRSVRKLMPNTKLSPTACVYGLMALYDFFDDDDIAVTSSRNVNTGRHCFTSYIHDHA